MKHALNSKFVCYSASQHLMKMACWVQAAQRLPGTGASGDPLDLLAADAPRALIRAGAGAPKPSVDEGFERGEGGRWVINEEDEAAPVGSKRKRRPGGGFDERASDDSDFDDLRARSGRPGGAGGASAKSVRLSVWRTDRGSCR